MSNLSPNTTDMLNFDVHSAPLRIDKPNLTAIDAVSNFYSHTPHLCLNKLMWPDGIDSHKNIISLILSGLKSHQLSG